MDLTAGFLYLAHALNSVFLSLGSVFSVTSLACALCLAIGIVAIQRRQRSRPIRWRTIVRALLPKRIWSSRSHQTDIGFMCFGVFLYGLLFGWAALSYQFLSNVLIDQLGAAFGPVTPTTLPDWLSRTIMTAVVFLAFELGYWFHHYLSHRIPFMWEFHKVHHTAEVLTPVTVFRVHPLDTMVYYNILAISMGLANGAMCYMLGDSVYQFTITDKNLLLVVFIHAYVHLQHTHLWVSFRGIMGRIFLSPAHHQVHHSTNPAHFNKNLGNCLAIWDWIFGTLYVPAREREKLTFGVLEAAKVDPHSFSEGMVMPVVRAARHIGASGR
ncbi:MAG TPA: sterol desaturase family protein [Pseudolabrys sp.]|nr:sterol desaturase family protein [Pseudolabrys sp.]